MKTKDGNAPGIHDVRIDFHVILEARKCFPVTKQSERFRWLGCRFFIGFAKSGSLGVETRAAAALKSVAAQERLHFLLARQIAEADDVDSIGPVRAVDRKLRRRIRNGSL